MTPHYNFQNYAILCENWQQMLHLAKLAKKQGYKTDKVLFCKDDFCNDHAYFVIEDNEFLNVTEKMVDLHKVMPYTKLTYTSFINSHLDIRVEGVKTDRDMINYIQEVKKVYLDAKCVPYYSPDSGDWQVIVSGNVELACARFAYSAWQSAYNNLKQQGKL